MIIRPISDLRNKYSELLEQVNKKYLFEKEFVNIDIDKELEEAEKEIDDPNT